MRWTSRCDIWSVRDRRLVGTRIADYDYGSRPLARNASHFAGSWRAQCTRRFAPGHCRACNGAEIQTIPLGELHVGDVVLVRPGTRVPADGVVVEGAADVDESMITGESKPVSKGPGAPVIAGTVGAGGSLRVRAAA